MKIQVKYQTMLLVVCSALLMFACKKESEINKVPVIKFIDVNSTGILEFKDSLIIHIQYSDEDGDLGEENPDLNSLQVKDRRLSEPDYYFVKPLAPPGENLKISGILKLHIKNTFLLGTGNSEITRFDIKLRDRAGNWSNTISSPEITINR